VFKRTGARSESTSFVGLLVAVCVLFSGCAQQLPAASNAVVSASPHSEGSASPAAVTVTDMARRSVEVPAQIETIVCAGPGALRLAVYLQVQDRVAGVEEFERRWDPAGRPYIMANLGLRDLPSIGPGGPGNLPDADALIKLNPDLVFLTYADARTADNIQSKTHIPVVVLNYGDDPFGEELMRSLELAGSILGREDRAAEVVAYIRDNLAELEERTAAVSEAQKPSVYVGGVGHKGAHGIESTQSGFPLLAIVHANNVADELPWGHQMVDREKVLEWDPAVIFVDEGGLELVRQDYAKNPGFYRALTAFQKGSVYGLLPYNFYTTNLATALADAYFVGKVLYPSRFEDVDPVAKADELYEFLVGKSLYREMQQAFGGLGKVDLATGQVR